MIWELLLKTFIPVSRVFDNEDDIFQECSKIQRQWKLFKEKKSKILWNINYIRMRRKIVDDYCL